MDTGSLDPVPSRRAFAIAAMAALLTGAGAHDAAAQAKKKPKPRANSIHFDLADDFAPIAISVLLVAQVVEESNSDTNSRALPIKIAWETGPWGKRELLDLRATLHLADDDGKVVTTTQNLGVKDKEAIIAVPVSRGHLSKHYQLTLVGWCRFTGEDGKVRIEPTTAELAGTL